MIEPRDEAVSVLLSPGAQESAWLRPQGILPPKVFLKPSRAGLEIPSPGRMMMIPHSFQEICRLAATSVLTPKVASCLNMSHILSSDSPHWGEQSLPPPTSCPHPHPCRPWGAFDQKMKRYDQSCACEQEVEAG